MHPAEKLPDQWPAFAYAINGRPEHLFAVQGKLRKLDAQEVEAASGKPADVALSYSWRGSAYRWAIVWQGQIIGLFGLSAPAALGMVGVPWLLGTDGLEEIKVSFIKESRRYLDYMLTLYPILANYVDARNGPAIKFLKAAGFTLADHPKPMGPYHLPFYYFEMRSNYV